MSVSGSRWVLGIDPGYDRCGWAVVEVRGMKVHCHAAGCIQTSSKAEKYQRFNQVWTQLNEVATHFPVTVLAMERLVFGRNVSTALPVSEVRGLCFAVAFSHTLPVKEYTPNEIKLAVTGYGRATKPQVLEMVTRLLKLEKIPNLDDTGDALAVALTYAAIEKPGTTL